MAVDTKQRLLAAAEAILIEQGVHALTIRRVGQVADVNSALITYHFGGVAGLLGELCRLNLAPIATGWTGMDDPLPPGSDGLRVVLERWLRPAMSAAAFTPGGRALVVLDEIAAHADEAASADLLRVMVRQGGRVHAALQPHVTLSEDELQTRIRYIAAATLGPPPRNRTRGGAGQDPEAALQSLLAFARAALRGGD